MRWRVLGPLEVWTGDGWTGVNAPKRRALLAALLAEPGRVVSTASLIDELWVADPPPAARKLVSGYVLRLRRLLGDRGGRILVTQSPGYRLVGDPAEVDAGRFHKLLAQGRVALADGDAARAADALVTALGLWRGPALADVPRGPLAAAEAARLEEARLDAVGLRIEAGLRCGSAAEFVPELHGLTAAHPLRERFWHLLMRVLAETGQPAEALAVYEQARRVIATELGADPGPDLQQLHRRILAGGQPPSASPRAVGEAVPARAPGDRQPAAAPADRQPGDRQPADRQPGDRQPAVPLRRAVTPRQLPGAVGPFTGREAELRRLSGLLAETADPGGAVVISAIGGTAGVGKTALAVHWAHQIAGQFPDGQLYVDLRGYDPGEPMTPADALAAFLRALGVAGQDIPTEADERATRYRSLLAGRRMLVLLDNAGSVAQVRPLLPGTATCVTVVTSRDSLAGLVARDGARRLDLDLLPATDAQALLTALIGDRAAADPVATAALAERCVRLPLALRVAAELAAARPDTPLASLVDELADEQRRLDLLVAAGDPRTAVRAVFSWSCQQLSPEAARTFRLAGLHPGADFDDYAVAALTGSTLRQAQHLLDLLVRAHLIHSAGPRRYAMHDLLRDYARELVASEDGEAERRAVLTRLFDHYLHAVAVAVDTLQPATPQQRHSIPATGTPVPPLAAAPSARAWLDAHRATLLAVAGHAAEHGWPSHAIQLAVTVAGHLNAAGHFPEAIIIHEHARRAARAAGDRAAEAAALNGMCASYLWQGHFRQVTGHLQEALALYRETGDEGGQARVLNNLGIVDFQDGRYAQAIGHYQEALGLFRRTGDVAFGIRLLNNLGLLELRQGRYQQASGRLREAVMLSREAGINDDRSLANLGMIASRQGQYSQATTHLREALTVSREASDPTGEAYALSGLASIDRREGRHEQAALRDREALALCRRIGHQSGEAEALNGLGEMFLATGRRGQATAQFQAALGLASQIGDKDEQARALTGLGHVCQANGDPGQARRHWQEALALYTDMGMPEADQVRASLVEVGTAEAVSDVRLALRDG